MKLRGRALVAMMLLAGSSTAVAQEFKVFDRPVQAHGFISQGFVHTDGNNWLTMNDGNIGSGVFTDFGVNLSSQLTDKLRVGAQLYDRNLGALGDWHPSLDWAVISYRCKPWLGIRGGKVKTTIGLDNDTQDLDFLHPFALLPQSVYPTDLRESTIAHEGGDVFGTIRLGKRRGSLDFTAYGGQREDSQYGGYPYLLKNTTAKVIYTSYGGLQYGGDLRWTTPVPGLLVGISRMNEVIDGEGTTTLFGPPQPTHEWSKADWTNQFFGQYTKGKLQVDAEYRRYWRDQIIYGGIAEVITDVRGWYLAGSYRFVKWFQLGSYYSQYSISIPPNQFIPSSLFGHIYDKVVCGRFDLNRFTYLKIEGHFMAGYGQPGMYPDGFYAQNNPQGFKPNTNTLVVKTGLNF